MLEQLHNLEFYLTPWPNNKYDLCILEDDSQWYTWVPQYQAFIWDDEYNRDSWFNRDFEHNQITKNEAVELIEGNKISRQVMNIDSYTPYYESDRKIPYNEMKTFINSI